MIVASILNIISKFIYSYETLIIGRFISGKINKLIFIHYDEFNLSNKKGLFCGLFSGILPLYLSELAPKNLRGTIGTLNQLMIVFGILVTNILGLPQLYDIYQFTLN